ALPRVVHRARAQRTVLHGRHPRVPARRRETLTDTGKQRGLGFQALARARAVPRARDDRAGGQAWRTECTLWRAHVGLSAHGHQLARAARQGRARQVAALPCPQGSIALHRGAPPLPMTDLSPRAMADVVVDAAGDKKAEDILVLNVSEITTIADLFVICTGRRERQVQALADAVREEAIEAGRRPVGVEGYNGGRWVLIDLGDVVVHAFVPEERQLYRLERLWGDAPVVLRIA